MQREYFTQAIRLFYANLYASPTKGIRITTCGGTAPPINALVINTYTLAQTPLTGPGAAKPLASKNDAMWCQKCRVPSMRMAIRKCHTLAIHFMRWPNHLRNISNVKWLSGTERKREQRAAKAMLDARAQRHRTT